MKKVIAYRGLTEMEYEAIKEAAKQEISFRVNIRAHKTKKYARGSIDIRPTAKENYKWTKEQFNEVLAFVKKNNLYFNKANVEEEYLFLCFKDGFTYTFKVDQYEEVSPVQIKEKQDDEYIAENETTETQQDILEIVSNGNTHSYLTIPHSIEGLIEALEKHSLDPTFEKYGNFISEYKPLKVTDKNEHLLGCTSFFGNFYGYSHVFNIVTNNENVVDKLTSAIRTNQQTDAYKQAKEGLNQREEQLQEYNRKQREEMNNNRRHIA